MSTNATPTTPPGSDEPAGNRAPFDPRRASTPAPRPPSDWLDPIADETPPEDVDADESFVVEDEPAPPVESGPANDESVDTVPALTGPRRGAPRRGKRLALPGTAKQSFFNPQQRLLILDSWRRSGLPAGDFAPLVGVSKHTLYGWKNRFEQDGPAGLMDRARGSAKGSRLSEVTKRAITMMKEANPDWGVQKITDMLLRGPGLAASPNAVAKVLYEHGCELVDVPTKPHPDKVRRFEKDQANVMWQTDLFTFTLKRQNQRVYLIAFMDDHSRFIVSYGLHASQSSALAIEALRAGFVSYGVPQEVLTDNGSQYVTWRGTSAFAKECQKRGIKQTVSSPRHPQTLGKTERFWGTLWRECVETAVFIDLGDARVRIGHFIDYYNFRRPHQGIGGLVPADRFFGAAPAMLATLKKRVAANALEIARNGAPKSPFYLAGNVNGQAVSVHASGDRLVMRTAEGPQQEVTIAESASDTARTQPMPVPVTPSGVPSSGWTGADGPYPPGVSPVVVFLKTAKIQAFHSRFSIARH